MSKIIKMSLVAAAIFSLSSCAAYNSIMPDWATGGAVSYTHLTLPTKVTV